jgi:methylmalonyl-CoA mutase N-terminal domain/subunit
MDNLFLKRVLFEWLRERLKEQAYAKISSLKKMGGVEQ